MAKQIKTNKNLHICELCGQADPWATVAIPWRNKAGVKFVCYRCYKMKTGK